jgi:hypothetical protein
MPNQLKYAPSIEALSLRKGDFAIGTGNVAKGPTSLTGFVNSFLTGTYSYVIFTRKNPNIFPRSSTTLAFTSAYNGSAYGFGAGTNIQQDFDDNLRTGSVTRITKVSRINSNINQRDYVYIGLSSPLNSVRIVSFWYYGTYGTLIQPYNNDASANISYLDANRNWVGNSQSLNVPVTVNVWQRIVLRITNKGTASGTGWSWLILHSNQTTTILSNTEYWAFTEFDFWEQTTLPGIYPIENNTQLVERTNQLYTFQTLTTIQECFEYFAKQFDKMIFNKDTDQFITDGLSLFLDAGSLYSYPQSGSVWYDLGPSQSNATLVNTPAFEVNSIKLDGTNEYVSTNYGKNINPFNNPITVSILIKPDSTAGSQMFISTGQSRGNGDSNQRLYVAIYNGNWDWGIRGSAWGSGTVPSSTKWNDITIVIDSTNARFYLNNQQIYTKSVNNSYVLNDNFWFGAHDDPTSYPTNAKIGGIKIYSRALSNSEISGTYFRSNIITSGLVFSSDPGNLVSYDTVGLTAHSLIGNFTASLVGGVTYSKNFGGTFNFDGTDEWMDFGNPPELNFGTSSLTVSVWYQRFNSATTNLRILAKGAGGDAVPGFAFFGSNSQLSFIITDSPSRKSVATTTSLSLDTWYHATGVVDRESSTLSIYINGVLAATRSDLTSTSLSGNSNFLVGANAPNSVLWKGLISLVSIYDRALSSSEILQNYEATRWRFGV